MSANSPLGWTLNQLLRHRNKNDTGSVLLLILVWTNRERDLPRRYSKLPVQSASKDIHRPAIGIVSRIGDELIIQGDPG